MGRILSYADFYALMPPDNAAAVDLGTDVSFPHDGPTSGTTITRTGPSTFNLSAIGIYQVTIQGSMINPGQLMLTLNGAYLTNAVLPGTSLVQTNAPIQ